MTMVREGEDGIATSAGKPPMTLPATATRGPLEVALSAAPPRLHDAALDVWRSLPADVRGALLRRWRDLGPIVLVVETLDRPGCAVLARFLRECDAFVFSRNAVERLCDEGLRALVAHELAHAYQAATGRPGDEREACAVAASWGFTFFADYESALWGGPGFETWAPMGSLPGEFLPTV